MIAWIGRLPWKELRMPGLSQLFQEIKRLLAGASRSPNDGGITDKSHPPGSLAALENELRLAFSERRSPAFERKDLDAWGKAINRICSRQLDVAEHAVRHLRTAFPHLPFARSMCDVFDLLPPADGSQSPFIDDPKKDCQIAARPGADLVILLFCGGAHKLGLPLSMMHRWLGRLPANLVYLRDFNRKRYMQGVRSLGPDLRITCGKLREFIQSLGARRLVCYGNSSGAFPALYYGQELSADRVMCLAGKANLTDEFNAFAPGKHYTADFTRDYAHLVLDARAIYQDLPEPPRVCMVYGQDYWNDRQHAEHMGALPCVTLWPVKHFAGHGATIELIRRHEYQRVLDWMISPA
jgi:hypothetical protein